MTDLTAKITETKAKIADADKRIGELRHFKRELKKNLAAYETAQKAIDKALSGVKQLPESSADTLKEVTGNL
jgi:phage shock protein A